MQVVHESLDRRHLELLIALRHTGHLGRAADQLSLSPSAASHRLKEMERRLGIAVTEVAGRSIRLTPGALHLADVALVADASLRSAEATARWMQTARRPTVRIALDFYDTAPWFEPLLDLEEQAADIDLVRVAYDDTTAAVHRRRADLGMSVLPVGVGEGDPLFVDELVAVVRADHAAAERGVLLPDDVATDVYLTSGDRPQHGFEHHGFMEPAGVLPMRLRKVESLSMILRLLRRWGGISVQPRKVLLPSVTQDLAIVPLDGPGIGVEWRAVHRPDPSDAVVELIETIRRLQPVG
ncbi:MAG: LysR family transcriptional regulator [Ilumatobacteraceae bacterium]|nr:LysR family transcriptional regulator [Ilumatobacteraceae bacterium]